MINILLIIILVYILVDKYKVHIHQINGVYGLVYTVEVWNDLECRYLSITRRIKLI